MFDRRELPSPVKRLFDIIVSASALILLLPLLLLVGLVSRILLGPGILFSQTRIGFNERPFRIRKFRTMLDARDQDGKLLPDEVRLTPYGKLLRATSIDELPGLWNVLVGEMSLVGPRPLLVHYLERYSSTQRRRHSVRPGITGLAQVKGRNAVTWEERLAWDVKYVDQRSFFGDLRILLDTAVVVLSRHGISNPGSATMTEFLGSPDRDSEAPAPQGDSAPDQEREPPDIRKQAGQAETIRANAYRPNLGG
jgi:lipopolysaccharide/colanic/teichoic acid biosynthesis glycosyltransferase